MSITKLNISMYYIALYDDTYHIDVFLLFY
jgi:hypothetical protein